MFLGEDLPSWLVLAFGAALAVGNLAALVMPQPSAPTDEGGDNTDEDGAAEPATERPPLVRSLIMIALGTAASIWAIASLVS